MSKTINTCVLELMASKVCHDIISPVGAVANGVEFLEEMGADAGDEAVSLIAFSAQQASAKLQMFRFAYGQGGADTSIKPVDVYNAFAKLIEPDGKITQEWDPYAPLGPEDRPAGLCKMLANGLLLAVDSLPKGGLIRVEGEGEDTMHIHATGNNAIITEEALKALAQDVNEANLSPKFVHPYLCGVLAEHYNFSFELESQEEGRVSFVIRML